uniref:Endonuclease/exonuclease/phosphatase domain-containing protein n=1 Tax=Heliothis virescens TaxID=7102 RepID=A0A2A4JIH6_HELVI
MELMDSLKNTKYDVVGLSEVRRTGTSIQEYDDFIFCYTGETQGLYGVGFIINKYLKSSIVCFNGFSERVALLKLNIKGYQLDILQVYAPTEASKEEEVESFYNTINETLKCSCKNVIVMGDFNSKIGQPRPEERLIMKNHGYGVRNSRGERLIEFAYENKLNIMNTFFKKPKSQRWTWRSPDGNTKNEIDYILTNLDKNVLNVQVLNVNFPTDHRLVRASIMLRDTRKTRTRYTNRLINTLKNETEISAYKLSLEKQIDELQYQEDATIQTNYENIIRVIEKGLHFAKNTEQHTTKPSVISAYTRKLIDRRKQLHKTKPKTRAQKNELKALYKLISKNIKRDYTAHRSKIIEKHISITGSIKRAYKELKTHRIWIKQLKETDKLSQNRTDIMKTATNFYKILYGCQTDNPTCTYIYR